MAKKDKRFPTMETLNKYFYVDEGKRLIRKERPVEDFKDNDSYLAHKKTQVGKIVSTASVSIEGHSYNSSEVIYKILNGDIPMPLHAGYCNKKALDQYMASIDINHKYVRECFEMKDDVLVWKTRPESHFTGYSAQRWRTACNNGKPVNITIYSGHPCVSVKGKSIRLECIKRIIGE